MLSVFVKDIFMIFELLLTIYELYFYVIQLQTQQFILIYQNMGCCMPHQTGSSQFLKKQMKYVKKKLKRKSIIPVNDPPLQNNKQMRSVSNQQQYQHLVSSSSHSKPQQSQRIHGPPLQIKLEVNQNNLQHKDKQILSKISMNPDVKKKKNAGLINIINTCYLNSALQCLYQTQQLNQSLQKLNGQFAQLYNKLCREMQKQSRSVNPSKIKGMIQNANCRFVGNQQHDAGEVLNAIFNIIHQETNQIKQPKIIPITYKYQYSDFQLFNKYVLKYSKMSKSIIDLVFVGCFKTTYQCCQCKKQKRLFQKFNIVYLPIPKPKAKSIQAPMLKNCFMEFSQTEQLEWDCLNCQKQTPHHKLMQIFRASKILILCLKRFKENNSKIQSSIIIPFQINLNDLKQQKNPILQQKYQLYGAIIHKGQYYNGHYVACCYDYRQNHWVECNDKQVLIIDKDQVQRKITKAYILFYKLKREEPELVQFSDTSNYLQQDSAN